MVSSDSDYITIISQKTIYYSLINFIVQATALIFIQFLSIESSTIAIPWYGNTSSDADIKNRLVSSRKALSAYRNIVVSPVTSV